MSILTQPRVAPTAPTEIAPVINPRIMDLGDCRWRLPVLKLAARLAASVVQRPRAGVRARGARPLVRARGLPPRSVPVALEGAGASRPESYRMPRCRAELDRSLAHRFALHHLQRATIQVFGDLRQ